jgi:hypothetical protein
LHEGSLLLRHHLVTLEKCTWLLHLHHLATCLLLGHRLVTLQEGSRLLHGHHLTALWKCWLLLREESWGLRHWQHLGALRESGLRGKWQLLP